MRARSASLEKSLLAALFVTGALFFVGSYWIDTSSVSAPDVGPQFVPRVFAGALMLFAALAYAFAKPAEEAARPTDRMALLVMVVLGAYAYAITKLGYVVSTFTMLAIVLFLLRAGSWWRIAIFAAAMTAVVYVVFESIMHAGLPVGPWGF